MESMDYTLEHTAAEEDLDVIVYAAQGNPSLSFLTMIPLLVAGKRWHDRSRIRSH
jgi:hypothetical protein